ncbi:sulfur carrier protein ThiS [Leeia oryzae]|uniref:sulfur carrier protein ThiS n=1 Tax=Leeia oryzae TaxID=356662 RepID=UPI00035CF86A|nr:sulfur carrier protein ThiS [Leeia oryzae]
MKLWINGEERTLPDVDTLQSALDQIGAVPPYAVAVNASFVPRSQYAQLQVQAGDAIEVVQAMAGG